MEKYEMKTSKEEFRKVLNQLYNATKWKKIIEFVYPNFTFLGKLV
jgi:hypothetical protein